MVDDAASLVWLAFRLAVVAVASMNAALSAGSYHRWRDARALRGLVSGVAMLGGALVTATVAPAIWESFPSYISPLRVVAAAGLTIFVSGLLFLLLSWWWQR